MRLEPLPFLCALIINASRYCARYNFARYNFFICFMFGVYLWLVLYRHNNDFYCFKLIRLGVWSELTEAVRTVPTCRSWRVAYSPRQLLLRLRRCRVSVLVIFRTISCVRALWLSFKLCEQSGTKWGLYDFVGSLPKWVSRLNEY